MDYKINLGAWTSVFAVPSAVVDKYILLAQPVQTICSRKMYVYAAQCGFDGIKNHAKSHCIKILPLIGNAVNTLVTFLTTFHSSVTEKGKLFQNVAQKTHKCNKPSTRRQKEIAIGTGGRSQQAWQDAEKTSTGAGMGATKEGM